MFRNKTITRGGSCFFLQCGEGQKFEKLRHCALTYLINYTEAGKQTAPTTACKES